MNVRLAVYRGVLTNTKIAINEASGYATQTTPIIIQVDGGDATLIFRVGIGLYNSDGDKYGVISNVNASNITLTSLLIALSDDDPLYYYAEKQFELDLQKAPNIVANYKWLDISKPDQRKSNFSQTIKIPFTNNNNKFFENWFDVNLDSLVYSTKVKYQAVVLVDSIPQLQGYIQLKAVYHNARLYEVVVFGDTANFFSDIKGKKLRDAFIDDNGVVDTQLDHINTVTNVASSWGTSWGSGGLVTVNGVTDNDVMYPIIDWGHTPFQAQKAMFTSPTNLEALNTGELTWTDFLNYKSCIKVNHLKPAIRLQRLLQIIIQKAGYSIKSTFLGIAQDGTLSDTDWFSRLFMTLAPQYPAVRTKVYMGFEYTRTSAQTITVDGQYNYLNNQPYTPVNWETAVFDPNNMFQTGTSNIFSIPYEDATPATFPSGSMSFTFNINVTLPATDSAGGDIESYVIRWGSAFMTPEGPEWEYPAGWGLWVWTDGETQTIDYQANFSIPEAYANGGDQHQFEFYIYRSDGLYYEVADVDVTVNSASIRSNNTGNSGYTNGNANAEVTMAENMPDVTQADFVKDIINKFNLIVTSDKDNPELLIIEPYQDYITHGTTQYWTDKLDVSKEMVVKSTNEIQSKELYFTDLSSKDYFNKSYEDKWGQIFGSRKTFNQNDFAKKDFKVFSIYSPFHSTGLSEDSNNIAVGQAFSIDESSLVKKPLEGAKPFLFYYSGTPLDITGIDELGSEYSFHLYSGTYTTLGASEAYDTGNKFPLCTSYNLDDTNGITANTKIAHWAYYSPYFETGYTQDVFGSIPSIHGFFNDYWAQYINEIYSDEARLMECYLNLDEQDIFNFDFSNPVYIKNTLWRVLEITNHLIGGNKTTKVKLLKAITKLNYDCDVIPNSLNEDGTITFINPATGATATVTNQCCENLDSNWTFQQTNNDTGVGDCYHNTNITTAPTDLTDIMSGVINGENNTGAPNIPLLMPILGANSNISIRTPFGISQEITLFLSATTYGSNAATFAVNGVNNNDLDFPPHTMIQVNLKLMATNVTGYSSTNAGDVAHLDVSTLIKRNGALFQDVGGTIVEKQNKDTHFPTPTISLINISNHQWAPTVTVSGDDTIRWCGKATLFIQQIPSDPSGGDYRIPAIYQNADNILMQDLNQLQWN